jgi:predicted transcriptional regulator
MVLSREDHMPTDQQIAVLCDIGQAAQFDSDKSKEVQDLIAQGYVERDGEAFRLTKKGEQLLTGRGVGLNES